jgi:hypothetical protein
MADTSVEDRLTAVEASTQAVHSRDLSDIAEKLDVQTNELTEVKVVQYEIKAVQTTHSKDICEIKAVQAVQSKDIGEIKVVLAAHTKDIGEIKTVQAAHTKDLSDIKVTLEAHSEKLDWLEKDSDVRHSAVVKLLQEVLNEVRGQ